jgi:hypothetical protein
MVHHGCLEWDNHHIQLTISSAICIGCHGTETASGVLDSGGSSIDTSGCSTGLVNSHYRVVMVWRNTAEESSATCTLYDDTRQLSLEGKMCSM